MGQDVSAAGARGGMAYPATLLATVSGTREGGPWEAVYYGEG